MRNVPFVSCLVLGFLQFFSHKAQVFLVVSRPEKSPGRTEGEGVDGCQYDDGDDDVGKDKY